MFYRVIWTEDTVFWTDVDADSSEAAIDVVKAGKYHDVDSDPGDGKKSNFSAREIDQKLIYLPGGSTPRDFQ